jgi:serine/threonine protein kinase
LPKVGQELVPGYKLKQLRSHGPLGTVWEAANAEGHALALKVQPCTASQETSKQVRAWQSVRHLHHLNLIRVEQIWSQPRALVIGMELADGSLLDLLEAYQSEYGTTLEAEEACEYLSQAAGALDYLNRRQHLLDGRRVGFQHCNVKPSNLLLIGKTVKLSDLALATQTSAVQATACWAGVPGYSAPEVFQGRLSDWTDQYSLAVTYYQLRSGQLPFPPTADPIPRSQSRLAPELSQLRSCERPILVRALSTVPQMRWPSCSEMMAQLSQAVKQK